MASGNPTEPVPDYQDLRKAESCIACLVQIERIKSGARYICIVTCAEDAKKRRAYPLRDLAGTDTAPGRKTDPGPAFDWQRFLRGMESMSNISIFCRGVC